MDVTINEQSSDQSVEVKVPSEKVVVDGTATIMGSSAQPASESASGTVRLANSNDVEAGTNSTSAVTPAALKPALDARVKVERSKQARGGQRVILRFDDGFASNLTIAAPHMAKYGLVGDLFTCTHPTEWLGTVRNGSPILTKDQLVELHTKYGWTIGSHTRKHTDAVATNNVALYAQELRDSIADLLSYGLPYPRAFVYPNGSRTRTIDRAVFRLFPFCGLVSGPLRAEANGGAAPVRHDTPVFLTDWLAIGWNGSLAAEAALIDAAMRHIEESWAQGISPIIAFHDIRDTPQEAFDCSTAGFKRLIDWIGTQGYPTGSVADLRSLNEVADPGFETYDPRISTWAGAYPWAKTAGWSRVSATTDDLGGGWAMRLDAASTAAPANTPQVLTQRIPVDSGAPYKTTIRARRPSHTSGDIQVVARWYTQGGVLLAPVGASAAGEQVIRTFASATPTSWVEQPVQQVRAPIGAASVQWEVRTSTSNGFQGVFEVSWAAWYRGDGYDPFESAPMPRWASDSSGGVPTSRRVNAGSGLTGGGDLSADRTLTVDFHTSGTSTKAVRSDDARLSDARTPISHMHDADDLTGVVKTVNGTAPDSSGNVTLDFSGGEAGESAYDIAVSNGFQGTESEWLASLRPQLAPSEHTVSAASGVVTLPIEHSLVNISATSSMVVDIDANAPDGLTFTIHFKSGYQHVAFASSITVEGLTDTPQSEMWATAVKSGGVWHVLLSPAPSSGGGGGGGAVALTGAGRPDGVVSAPIGTTYVDTEATTGARVWAKVSGTDSTGWTVIEGDTGQRFIEIPVPPTNPTRYSWGGVLIRRAGNIVNAQFWAEFEDSNTMSGDFLTGNIIPVGFRPQEDVSAIFPVHIDDDSGSPMGSFLVAYSGSYSTTSTSPTDVKLTVSTPSTGMYTNGPGYTPLTWITPDPWPTTLPGSER